MKHNIIKQSKDEAVYSILIVLMASPAAASSCPATHNLRAAPRACFLQVIILLLTFSHSFNQSVERLVVNPLKVGGVAPCAVYCAPRITLQLFRSHAQRIITSLRESAAVILEKVNASQLLEEAVEVMIAMYGEQHGLVGFLLHNLGRVERQQKRHRASLCAFA